MGFYSVRLPLQPQEEVRFGESSHPLPVELLGAASGRQLDFRLGRYCAQTALRFKAPSEPSSFVGVGPAREPLWPPGWVGSITHTQGMVAAVVALSAERSALGIDIEPLMDETRAARIESRVLTLSEMLLPARSRQERVTAVFSAKESIYKCLRPLVGKYFGFHAVAIRQWNLLQGTFHFVLLEDLTPPYVQGWEGSGRLAVDGAYVFTAVELVPLHQS